MINPLANYNADSKTIQNYWEFDNQLATIGIFKDLYQSDKSKKKTTSSRIMWAVAFFQHPESRLINFSTTEKKDIIESDITKEPMDWNDLATYITAYKNLYYTQATRSLENWKVKLEERDEYLNSLPYKDLDLDSAKLLDTLLANTPKLYKQYDEIKQQISDEESKGRTKAGIQESASEQGLI
jgi:hypothetical protein